MKWFEKRMNQLLFTRQGSSFVEVIVATAVVGVVLTSIVMVLTYSIQLSSQARYRSLATRKAQETLDMLMRERVVLGWDGLISVLSETGTYCVRAIPDQPSASVSDHIFSGYEGDPIYLTAGECFFQLEEAESPVRFKRELDIEYSSPPITSLTATVTVSWQKDNGDEVQVQVKQVFSQW